MKHKGKLKKNNTTAQGAPMNGATTSTNTVDTTTSNLAPGTSAHATIDSNTDRSKLGAGGGAASADVPVADAGSAGGAAAGAGAGTGEGAGASACATGTSTGTGAGSDARAAGAADAAGAAAGGAAVESPEFEERVVLLTPRDPATFRAQQAADSLVPVLDVSTRTVV